MIITNRLGRHTFLALIAVHAFLNIASEASAAEPSSPAALRAEVYSSTAAELFWDRPDVFGLHYEVLRDDASLTTINGVSFFDDTLSAGTTYKYTVMAIDRDGQRSAASTVKLETNGDTSARLPAPTGLRAEVYSSTAAELFWDRPDVFGLRYEVRRDGSAASTIDGISFFDDTLAKGRDYVYQIIAIDTAGKRSTPAPVTVRTDSASEPHYRLSTKFQGTMHPLEFELGEQGVPVVKLAETISADDTQLWTMTAQGDSFYRIQNVSASSGRSLAIVENDENQPVQMIDTDLQSDQLWQVIALNNGFCQISSQLLGPDLSLDIVNEAAPRQLAMAPTGNFSGQHWQLSTESGAQIDDTLARCTGPDDTPPTDEPNDNPIAPPDSPPFSSGTNFIDSDIITPDDPSSFLSITANGTGERVMFDRRVNDWVTLSPYLFTAEYDDGLSIELQINPEFSEDEASETAETYARYFGQLPTLLRRDVDTSWIHKGVNLYGGGNRNLLVHTGQSADYLRDGILEETLIHEASHTSLDSYYATANDWLAAQRADPTFISTYAMENPDREDIAESFLLYVALRYRRDRISDDLASTIEETMPNRIQFFDSIVQDMYPLE